MIGSGAHHGFAGIRHTIGAIGLAGGVHTIASTHFFIGIIAIGTTTITPFAPTVPAIITTITTMLCETRCIAMIMHIAIQSARSLRETRHAM